VRLVVATPPAAEPVTLAEAKLHLRVDFTDDDALITGLIAAARQYCETVQKRSYITTVWDMYLDQFPGPGGGYYNRQLRQLGPSSVAWFPGSGGILEVPRPPLVSVQWVKYLDPSGSGLVAVDPATYSISAGTPGRIQPNFGKVWPIPIPQIDAVQVRFTAGFGASGAAVSDSIKSAMKLMIGHWYEHREAAAEGAVATVPLAVDALLAADDWGSYS
jgi:hypothetical protein